MEEIILHPESYIIDNRTKQNNGDTNRRHNLFAFTPPKLKERTTVNQPLKPSP